MTHLDGVNVAMVSVDADTAIKVRNGRSFESLGELHGRSGDRRIVLNDARELIAVYAYEDGAWRAEVVMPEPLA